MTPARAPRAGAPGRAARTAAAAGVALASAVGGHLAAGGAPPAALGVLTATAALALPGWWLTGRERGWARLGAALVAGQLTAHALFTATAGGVGGAAPGHHGTGSWVPADLMLLAHLLAAAVGAAWLRRGERRAWAALRRAGAALQRTVAGLLARPVPVPTAGGAVRGDVQEDRPTGRTTTLRNIIVLRGPPLGC